MKKLIFGMVLSLVVGFCVGAEAFQSAVDKALSDNIRQGDGKITMGATNPLLDVSAGYNADESPINVSGNANDGIQTSATDIWDLADLSATQQIWLAPDAAVTHWIVSSSVSDASAGVGARTVRIRGLIDWDTPEVIEDVVMNGTTSVTTGQSYVAINSLEVLTKGATNVNVGAISAFATDDGTIAARILAGAGQSQMAIYSISSIEDAYLAEIWGTVDTSTATLVDYSLHVNPEPDSELTRFIKKKPFGVSATGSSYVTRPFKPYLKIGGPAIIKMQGVASAADIGGSAGFDGVRKIKPESFDDFNVIVVTNRNRALDGRILTTSDGRIIRTTQ